MKVEIKDNGVVFCDKKECVAWMDGCTCCDDCPVEKMLEILDEYQQKLAQCLIELTGSQDEREG